MNNYCTNCGKQLEKDELLCKNCNTPIIDLPYDYEYISPEKKKRKKITLIIVGVCILCFSAVYLTREILFKIKINKFQKEYVEPYIKQNYSNTTYSIEYSSFGKCIISENHSTNICICGPGPYYEYLDDPKCKSYYFSVKNDEEEFEVTVVDNHKHYSVVEGRNIYGTDKQDKKKNEEESVADE